jgi:hypothetical protein
MEDWLKKRLSPYKVKDARWTGLAVALQEFWEDNFDPEYARLLDMRSVYTASPEDLAHRLRELGDYFTPDYPTEFDQPLTVAWRESELQRKGTEFILISTFRRNFSGMDVRWMPLWADKSGEYGSGFLSADLVPSGDTAHFLTSRGKVLADLSHLYADGRWSKTEFAALVLSLVRKLKPLHIVYDGMIFVLHATAGAEISALAEGLESTHAWSIDFYRQDYFDEVAADVRALDFEKISRSGARSGRSWETDWTPPVLTPRVRFDEIPADMVCLDDFPLDPSWNTIVPHTDFFCGDAGLWCGAPFLRYGPSEETYCGDSYCGATFYPVEMMNG